MANIAEIAQAIATKAHEGQFRKLGDDKGKPYIIHPERVASRFMNDELRAIAWLHDVLEDNPMYSPEMLYANGMPIEVVDAVKLLTRQPDQNYVDYIRGILNNYSARQVKLADLCDNLRSCPKGNMRDKYLLAQYILERGYG